MGAEPSPIWRLVDRYTPRQGWDTFLLLVLAVGVVALTLRQGDWVETPGLFPVVFWSCLAGLALAKVRGPWPLLFPAGLAIGVVFIVWQGFSQMDGQQLTDRIPEFWDRLGVWYEAASTGGISTDLMPLSLGVLSMTWILGYVSSWFLFRSNNVWVGLVLAGTSLMTILSLLPDTLRPEFLVFMLLAMLLVTRMSTIQRREQWRREGVSYVPIRWLGMRVVSGLSVLVLLVTAALPFEVMVSRTAVEVWNFGRTPVSILEDDFGRLFSGVPSRKDLSGRFFGTTLPFQGKISFEGEVVFMATSIEPAYWLSRSYSEYTSQGWKAGKSKKQRAGPNSLPPPPQESAKRELVSQRLDLSFSTNNLLAGGNLAWISRDAVVETLAPLKFEIDLLDASGDGELPEDVQRLAQELRQELSSPTTIFVESSISRMLPQDLTLVSISPDGKNANRSRPETVKLARKDPVIPDAVSWKFVDRLRADDSYSMRSFVSDATSKELNTAGTNYSGFLKDHYLQLPASLPQRVKDLALGLTEDAETPLEKVLIIQSFLRGPTFTYSQDIAKPPTGADGVDHFLFETRVGYSDYFGSAMAVMLRSAGVPARMAAGYAPGELEDGTGRRAVKDSDSHGWTQVYFPGHGWIDFEPTTRWSVPSRGGIIDDTTPDAIDDTSQFNLEDCIDPSTDEYKLFIDECVDEEAVGSGDVGNIGGLLQDTPWDPASLLVPLGSVAGVLAGLALAVWIMWNRGLANLPQPEGIYTKMSRLGTLAGIGRRRNQTPGEYAMALGSAVPAVATGANQVASAYAADRYGNQELTSQALEDLNEVWKRVRGGVLAGILRKLLPL